MAALQLALDVHCLLKAAMSAVGMQSAHSGGVRRVQGLHDLQMGAEAVCLPVAGPLRHKARPGRALDTCSSEGTWCSAALAGTSLGRCARRTATSSHRCAGGLHAACVDGTAIIVACTSLSAVYLPGACRMLIVCLWLPAPQTAHAPEGTCLHVQVWVLNPRYRVGALRVRKFSILQEGHNNSVLALARGHYTEREMVRRPFSSFEAEQELRMPKVSTPETLACINPRSGCAWLASRYVHARHWPCHVLAEPSMLVTAYQQMLGLDRVLWRTSYSTTEKRGGAQVSKI